MLRQCRYLLVLARFGQAAAAIIIGRIVFEVPGIILRDVWVSNGSELWFLDRHGQDTARIDLCYQNLLILEHVLLKCVGFMCEFLHDSLSGLLPTSTNRFTSFGLRFPHT